jgi:hypothetical protein
LIDGNTTINKGGTTWQQKAAGGGRRQWKAVGGDGECDGNSNGRYDTNATTATLMGGATAKAMDGTTATWKAR